MQLAPARDFKHAVFGRFPHAQGHVALQLFLQAVPDLAAGDVFALAPGQRAGVDAKVHGQRRLVNLEHGQRLRAGRVGDGGANVDVFNAVDEHDVARVGLFHLHAVQPLEGEHLVHAALGLPAFRAFHHQHVHARPDGARVHAAHANAAHERGIVQRRNLQLQRRVVVALVRGHVLENGLEQRRHVRPPLLAGRAFFQRRPAVDAAGIHHGKVQLLVRGAQLVEQVECGVDHLVRVGAGLVHLVDHHDGFKPQRQRLFGDKARLRHGAFLRVDEQQYAIDHAQGALHLAAKVRVAGRIDDVDVRAPPGNGAVLGQDGDAPLALDGVAVHHGIHHFFVVGKSARLAQQLINHGGFAVVHVGDDGDIANLGRHESELNQKKIKRRWDEKMNQKSGAPRRNGKQKTDPSCPRLPRST